jgi:CzcA family heavy metal efflux pump
MWIVRLALRRPYTFVVAALGILLAGVFAILRMPTDILPEADIPVIASVWTYNGMAADELEKRVTSIYERALFTTVNDIEHVESQTLAGVAVVKVFFHPSVNIAAASAEVSAASEVLLKQLPPGITPPLIIRYSASNVPIMEASLASDQRSEQSVLDLATNFVRPGLAVVEGAQMPLPYGGKQRMIMVDLDPERMYALGISPSDVSNAINAENVILPSGTAKMGRVEYGIRINTSPNIVAELNRLPVKQVGGATIYMEDVAHVRDGFAPQTNLVKESGKKGALLPILKSSGASTLTVAQRVRAVLPTLLATLPNDLKLRILFDQSVFVRSAVSGVVREAAIAAVLTGLMILLFLGSWRSTLVVVTSIPLAVLFSIVVLSALGQTLNLMTLGGLALAVGILVDDATVTIENVHRNLAEKKPLVEAILDGAQQIAVPAFVSTICICIVFLPVAFISGSARSLFIPLAMSVVFAMLASYGLSRTLVPTMIRYIVGDEHRLSKGAFNRIHDRFERAFERMKSVYARALELALGRRRTVIAAFSGFALLSLVLLPFLGRDFFPPVDAGQIRLHVRAPPRTRIEETERWFAKVEDEIRRVIPKDEIGTVIDNIGTPVSGINLALGDPSMISSADGEIAIALDEKHHGPTASYVRRLRDDLTKKFPALTFFFLPPDITTQVLNFGLSAPIDVEVSGPLANQEKNRAVAETLKKRIAAIPGAVDVHLAQVTSAPELDVTVDRTLAEAVGLTERDVASDVLISLSSSSQTAPSFWLDPKGGVAYPIAVETPQYLIDSIPALTRTPIVPPVPKTGSREPQLLGNLATVARATSPVNITHDNVMPTFDVLANVDGTDLGSVSDAVDRIVSEAARDLPRGTSIRLRGQVESMKNTFSGLAIGLVLAVVLVYLLMVVNFQSLLDPLIILMALPGALAGILWMLLFTRTTINVPALMGAIMAVGVATANSILVVTFANDQRVLGLDAKAAALAAGVTRLRPVLMTALAMIIGMLPMALGLGEGGEQNAPLGRAVIGGLILATFATLFFVPLVYSALRKKALEVPHV